MYVAKVVAELLGRGGAFTDIMMQSDAPVMLKTPRGWFEAEVAGVPSMADIREFGDSLESDLSGEITKGEVNRPYEVGGQRLRVNIYLANAGASLMLSMRRIPDRVPSLQELGLPAALRILLDSPAGLLLVSGPTGAGKTTSMAAMVNAVNGMRNAHIVTVEDPIEYVFQRDKSIFSQREVGVDCDTVLDGVRAALRQRPDVIVIGEIRDRATAEQALLAGESGHLVIGTLHASSAVGTVSKVLSFFADNEREAKVTALAGSLLGIVNQTLIPRKDGTGYALAVDFLANHKRDYSKHLSDGDRLQAMLERAEDKVSMCLAASAQTLMRSEVVSKADVMRAISANPIAYEAVRS